MRFRKLRIAWSVGWGVLAVLLGVLLVRSINRIDRLTWHEQTPNAVRLQSGSGRISINRFDDQLDSSPEAILLSRRSLRHQGTYDTLRLIDGATNWKAKFASTNNGGYLIAAPNWLLMLMFAGIATIPWLRFRFSLRKLLIATTLITVVLGMIVWLSRAG